MATFNKRGYKAPKEKEVKEEIVETVESTVDDKNSTTAGVFSKLDESASKTEDWIAKNQNIIIGIVGAVALLTIVYLGYQRFVVQPNEEDAANEMFVAQQNFKQATDGVASDSLYKLALNGSEGKFGFIKIADEYSGTAAANLANYYAGIAFLNTGNYDKAIDYLNDFKSDDTMLRALAKGAIGDAYSQKNQAKEALDFYEQAANYNKNDFTTPRFLMKAGKTALLLKNKETALKYFKDIKENYQSSPEASVVDALIGLSK